MALKLFFVISAVAIRPLSHSIFRDMCTLLSRVLFSRKGNFIRSSGRAIDSSAPEESEEISFRINITNSISRRVPMDHDSHRRWHPREMYGWHQHMHEGQPLSVSAAHTIDCLLTLVLRSLLAGGVIARRGWGRRARKRRKKKSGRIDRRARAEVLAAMLWSRMR